MIRAFDARDYAIGTVYTKTEVVQVAVFSLVFLGESLRPVGWLATVVCFAGVVVLRRRTQRVAGRRPGRAAGHRRRRVLRAGAVASAPPRSRFDSGSVVARALVTLAVMNTMQIVMHGGYLVAREREQARLAVVHWRSSSIVGLLSVCGSACWALAFTLQNAARVRTFGQIELLITFAVAHFWLGERHGRREYLASGLVLTGVVGVMIAG